jgi:hypothetical protein
MPLPAGRVSPKTVNFSHPRSCRRGVCKDKRRPFRDESIFVSTNSRFSRLKGYRQRSCEAGLRLRYVPGAEISRGDCYHPCPRKGVEAKVAVQSPEAMRSNRPPRGLSSGAPDPQTVVHAVLAWLLGPSLCASVLGREPGEFAVPLASVLQTGVTEGELRQLISAGYIECRTKPPESSKLSPAVFAEEPGWYEWFAFHLTPAGTSLALQHLPLEVSAESLTPEPVKPCWRKRELWFRNILVKRFTRVAKNQMRVLDLLEQRGWPSRLDNPFESDVDCPALDRLINTVSSLNRLQENRVLVFEPEPGGGGLQWREALRE